MKERTKPKGIGMAAILAVLLLTGSMFASGVMAQPAQDLECKRCVEPFDVSDVMSLTRYTL